MGAELQPLIDKIQKEAVDKAGLQAEDIIKKAEEKAAVTITDAQEQSKQILEKAEKESEAFSKRSQATLEQAGRDVLISVGQGVERILSGLIVEKLNKALTLEVLQKMLVTLVEEYATQQVGGMELSVAPKEKEQWSAFFKSALQEKLAQGAVVRTDSQIVKGFKVSIDDSKVHHDFTDTAIAESLEHFLRPELAALVHQVARDIQKESRGSGT